MAAPQLNSFWLAQAAFRRLDFDECIALCTALLAENPYDQAVWLMKCRALTEKAYLDDVDWDEEGIADALLDDNATAQAPRPGTSLQRPGTSAIAGLGAAGSAMRPMTASGRPVTGFARPGTSSIAALGGGGLGSNDRVATALRSARPGTSRVTTSLGRTLRLGTASMLSSPGGPFIQVDRLDMRKYAKRPALAKALMDYLLYAEHNPRAAVELGALGTVESGYGDWWWKERLGKAYYRLGLLRDAEKQFNSSAAGQPMVATALQAARVTERLDQPLAAVSQLATALDRFPGDTHLLLAQARVHEAMGDTEAAAGLYKQVLSSDAINVEALACLAGHAFYSDQPEIGLRYYRRLLQIGVDSAELWADLGLACFHAGQYDLCVPCFDRALAVAEDDAVGDIWFNVAGVALALGDTAQAEQALHVALASDPNHAESHVNLAILAMRQGKSEAARSHLASAQQHGEHLYEAWFNGALLAYRRGELQDAHGQCSRALALLPEHPESLELMRLIKEQLARA